LERKHVLQDFFALSPLLFSRKLLGKVSRANTPALGVMGGVSNRDKPLKNYQGMVFPFWQWS